MRQQHWILQEGARACFKNGSQAEKIIPQWLKPQTFWTSCGTSKLVPFQGTFLKHAVEAGS
jgi:hypothetical protein